MFVCLCKICLLRRSEWGDRVLVLSGSKKPIDGSICGAVVWYGAEVMGLTVDLLAELGKIGKHFDKVNSRSE